MFRYRVWDKKYNCWVTEDISMTGKGQFVSLESGFFIESFDQYEINIASSFKDKHDKDIYQNDIIKWHGDLKLIVWHAGGLCVLPEYFIAEDVKWYLPESLGNVGFEKEIVGNFYQHKHLLRKFK